MKILNNSIDKKYVLMSENEGDITINNIKKAIDCIEFLHNTNDLEITVSGGCVDVIPLEDAPNLDPIILRNDKVLEIGRSTLTLEIIRNFSDLEGGYKRYKYKTKKFNHSFTYQGKEVYMNTLDKVEIKY